MDSKNCLLIDCCDDSGFNFDLCESSQNDGGLVKFRGKFQEANAVNKNKRMYSFDVLDQNVQRLQESVTDRRLVGELDHPTDSIIHFAEASHVVTKLWWDGNVLMGEGEILNTPHGKVLKALINDGVKIGISSRGVGNGKVNEDGTLVIGESYKLITFDAVADPSTYSAFQEKIDGGKKKTEGTLLNRLALNNKDQDVFNNSRSKNEGRSINSNVNKDALIACLGGIVKSQTQTIKSRLTNGQNN